MASEYGIAIDLSPLLDQAGVITRDIFPRIHQAVGAVALAVQQRWADAVMKTPGIWVVERQEYAKSLRWAYTGHFSARVYTDYQPAEWIESGRPERDLKRMLDTSTKVRLSSKGKRYLIIPFRHNVPGPQGVQQGGTLAPQMPPAIYALAKQLAPSRVIGKTQRLSGTGAWDPKTKLPLTVGQKIYLWGGALPAGLAPKLKPAHATDPYAGMRRFDTSTGKAKSSAYLTFRTMVEGSPKWIVPAQPGKWVAQGVANNAQPLAQQILGEAMRREVVNG